MQGSAGDLVDLYSKKRIVKDGFLLLSLLALLGNGKALKVGKTNGSFRLVFLFGVVVLVRLAGTKDVELEGRDFWLEIRLGLGLGGFHWLLMLELFENYKKQ